MVALVATNVVSAVLSAISLLRLMGPATHPPRYGGLRELYSFTTVAWLTSLTNSGLIWAGTIMLGLYAIPAEVGIYQVAARLVLLGTIFIQPVTTSFAPRVADLYQRGQTESLRDTYVLITSWIFRLALPSFIILMVFAEELLAIFGSGFTGGTTVTVVLALAQLVNSATGPCGYMLLMSGRHTLQSINNVAALVVNIALNLWLIPRYGIVGAAISWAVVIGGFNIVRVIQVWAFLGMLPIDRVMGKGVVAGGVGAAAAAVVSLVLEGPLALAVGAGVVVLTYFSTIVVLGIGPDDRLVLDLLRRKLGLKSA
jgi:O-antigen/teichoic acid export membrane protein